MRALRLLNTPPRLGGLFLAGLVLRFVLIGCLAPAPVREWFAPFLEAFCAHPSFDPWTTFLASGGAVNSFPYGIIMLLVLAPASTLAHAFGGPAAVGTGILVTILFVDIVSLVLLRKLLPNRSTLLLLFWWLSPIVLAACYWVGQLDAIPVCLLLGCFVLLKSKRYTESGIFFALALSAKLSMALAAPFLLLYFLRNARMRPYAKPFLLGLVPLALLTLGLPLFSTGYHAMTLGTSELTRLLDLRVPLGKVSLYLTPIIYILVAYAAWRVPFLSFDLLTAFTALAMFTVVLTTATPPGWQLWAWPFLLLHLIPARTTQRLLGCAFSVCVALSQIFFWPPPLFHWGAPFSGLPLPQGELYMLLLTVLFSMGAMLMAGVLRNGIRANEIYRFGQHPISIAIAGDSGVGKDTLAENLIGLFGPGDTTHISGDDYHLWDRNGAAWKMITHLNPRANDLKRLFADVNDVLDGKKVIRRQYRHCDGHFSAQFSEEPRHFFIVSGLHTLISDAACARFDLRIFLEMDEALRVYFKCRRDAGNRGQDMEKVKTSIAQRKPDGLRYITPQAQQADIIFVRTAVHSEDITLDNDKTPANLLEIRLRRSLYHEDLVRQLISLCGLRVDVTITDDMAEVVLRVDGEIVAEDMAFIASRALPELEEVLAVAPKWQNGIYGIMQLVCLYQLAQTLKVRR